MPHYSEESAAWQAAIEAPVGARLEQRVIFDPNGRHIDLSRYLDKGRGVRPIQAEAEVRQFNLRGRELALTFNALGTDKFNRWNSDGILYEVGWYDKPVEIWGRLHGPSGPADKLLFTGFMRSPGECRGGATWRLTDQLGRMRGMELKNIDEISAIKIDFADLEDPSYATLDRTAVVVADTTKSQIETWTIIFENHPNAPTGGDDAPEYQEGFYYVRGSKTGVDTAYLDTQQGGDANTSTDYTTESGILTIPASAWDTDWPPQRGDRFTFLTTIRLLAVTPAAAIKDILQNHSDLEADYIDTTAMNAADLVLGPAFLQWEIHRGDSLLKIIEILARHALIMVSANASGQLTVKLFAPEYEENYSTINKAVDLIRYEPDEVGDDFYNVIAFTFDYDWREGAYREEYTYPDDVGTLDDDSEPPVPFTLGNESADLHGVERVLELELPGFTDANRAWLRFVGGWYYAKYSEGLELGWAHTKLHGLTVEPGERYSLESGNPARSGTALILGYSKDLPGRSVKLRTLKADQFLDDSVYLFCDGGEVGPPDTRHKTDNGLVVW